MQLDLKDVPNKPGVYMWLDYLGNVLYVGKANKLKIRMNQYFKGMTNSYKTSTLVNSIKDFQYIITKDGKNALILERNLIAKYFPPFNIKLTDDKRYPYIKIKLRKKLEVNLVYKLSKKAEKAIYFGPFPSGFGARKLTNLVQRMTIYEKGLPSKKNEEIYWQNRYDYAKKLLSSKNNFLINDLKKKMFYFSQNFQYEIAHDIQETLAALNFYKDKQAVELQDNSNFDVIGIVEKNGYLSISMLFYRAGILLSKKDKILEIIESKSETTRQYISQYYDINIKPEYIISNYEIESEIKIINPKQGNKKTILKIAIENAQDKIDLKLNEFIRKSALTLGAIKKLCKLINIQDLTRIVMIDNSSINNTSVVSAIVSYVNGMKKKDEYRKFNIVSDLRKSDVEYMSQGLQQYFLSKNLPLINLVIVDGGKAQINEAKKIVTNIPVVGLVKNADHKTRALIINNKEIKIQDPTLKNFLIGMQIEVDRYAKIKHAQRRKKTLEGKLLMIQGVGLSIEKKLLNHFQNYANIYNATLKDLEVVVSKKLAKKIKEELN